MFWQQRSSFLSLPFSEGRESKYKEEKSAMGLAGLKPNTF
jgi:hypothetical protein